jgi:hypothetical protein
MLNRSVAVMSLLLVCGGAMRAEQVDVTYVCGTIQAISAEASSKLDTTSPSALELQAGTSQTAIPYAAITGYEYREENRFRLGVLPAIAVGALKARTKRHLITITWKDEAGVAQTATFDATRDGGAGLVKVLEARAPQATTKGLPWRSKRSIQ